MLGTTKLEESCQVKKIFKKSGFPFISHTRVINYIQSVYLVYKVASLLCQHGCRQEGRVVSWMRVTWRCESLFPGPKVMRVSSHQYGRHWRVRQPGTEGWRVCRLQASMAVMILTSHPAADTGCPLIIVFIYIHNIPQVSLSFLKYEFSSTQYHYFLPYFPLIQHL